MKRLREAAAITTTLGETFIAVLDKLFTEKDGEPPSQDEVIAAVGEAFRK